MIVGILCGLGAAVSQSLSFLGSRHYAHQRQNPARELLVLGHLWMGLMAAVVLVIAWPTPAQAGGSSWRWLLDPAVVRSVLLMTFFYIWGQVGLTIALRHAEPSRVSPLMGLKIIFIAGLSAFWPQPQYDAPPVTAIGLTALQWSGVILSVVAAVALNFAGTRLNKGAIGGILLACVSYTFADWNIAATNRDLHHVMPGAGIVQISFLNAGLCYLLTALLAALFAPFWGSRRLKDWRDAFPFAAAWFAGMLFLYWCYGEVGPLLGVILQSSRGLISIMIGTLLIYLGQLHMEPHSPRHVLLRRLAAGALMFAAVSLYVLKTPMAIAAWFGR